MLQEVAQWLPRADARRARLVCRAWRGALAGLATAAATPAEASTVTRWRAQLEAMVASLPCLRELTVGSRLSDVGAQQLAALAGVPQLRMLRIPHGHALRDRGVQVRTCLCACAHACACACMCMRMSWGGSDGGHAAVRC
jgi:hypothetical protein